MTAARTGWLTWLVIMHRPNSDPWVIAAFDQRGDADAFAFAASKVEPGSRVTYTVEPDPLFTRLQTLRGAS